MVTEFSLPAYSDFQRILIMVKVFANATCDSGTCDACPESAIFVDIAMSDGGGCCKGCMHVIKARLFEHARPSSNAVTLLPDQELTAWPPVECCYRLRFSNRRHPDAYRTPASILAGGEDQRLA